MKPGVQVRADRLLELVPVSKFNSEIRSELEGNVCGQVESFCRLITGLPNCLKGRKRQFVGNKGIIGSQGYREETISGEAVGKRRDTGREPRRGAGGYEHRRF